jgi:DNA-binding transcriptional regulator LsrR (DeoR family)
LNFNDGDNTTLRLISQILTLYYFEDKNQSEVAKALGLSTAKVNRLLKQAKEQGLVEIKIHTPFNHLLELERRLRSAYGIPEAFIIPQFGSDPDTILQTLGRAAADYLLQRLRDGDTICISGGKAVHAIVEAIEPTRQYNIRVVPATGARQGKHFTDVNYLAARLAERLGGKSYQLNAPIFVDTPEERETLLAMRHVSETLQMAREAQIALVGIGSMIPHVSSYFDLLAAASVELNNWDQVIEGADAHGEIFAYVFNGEGELCLPQYNQRVVGLEIDQLRQIPLTIGVAATHEKVQAIHGALHGGYLKTLITDEMTAQSALELAQAQVR